jgi:glycine betaine/proline transport system substrate-binding protein
MSFTRKIMAVASAVLISIGIAFSAGAPAQAGGLLTAPEADWTGGQVTCKIIQFILEDEMGYKVKRITMPAGPGISAGMKAGDLDFACESWPSYSPSKEKYIAEYGGDGSVIKLGDAGIIGATGYYVPRYMVEGPDAIAPDLKKITDLNNYVDLFKTIETGDKGRFVGCPVAAWACEDAERLEAQGLSDNFIFVELGSETAHWAELQAAYKRGEPFVFYTWEPHWIHAALDLVALEQLPFSADNYLATAWADDVTYNYGRPGMLTEHPAASQLIINSYLTNDAQAGMILAIDVDGRDLDEVVREWMAANEDTWRPWIPNTGN